MCVLFEKVSFVMCDSFQGYPKLIIKDNIFLLSNIYNNSDRCSHSMDLMINICDFDTLSVDILYYNYNCD